jgi:ketosteroid isomerase-like protein
MSTPRDVFERYLQCVLHKDWQAFGELFTDDAVLEFPFALARAAARHDGREAIRAAAHESWSRIPLAFEELRSVVAHEARDPEHVFGEYELCGTIAPSGERFAFPFALALRVRDGRIASAREYLHLLAIAGPTGRAAEVAARLLAPSSGPTPLDVWQATMRCYLQRDIDGFANLFAPDGVMELPFAVPGVASRMTGRDEIHRTLAPLWHASAATGVRVLGHEVLAAHSGDPSAVAVEFEVFGEEATGATYRLRYVHALRIDRDGRIALLRDYVDARVLAERRAAVIAAAGSPRSRA